MLYPKRTDAKWQGMRDASAQATLIMGSFYGTMLRYVDELKAQGAISEGNHIDMDRVPESLKPIISAFNANGKLMSFDELHSPIGAIWGFCDATIHGYPHVIFDQKEVGIIARADDTVKRVSQLVEAIKYSDRSDLVQIRESAGLRFDAPFIDPMEFRRELANGAANHNLDALSHNRAEAARQGEFPPYIHEATPEQRVVMQYEHRLPVINEKLNKIGQGMSLV